MFIDNFCLEGNFFPGPLAVFVLTNGAPSAIISAVDIIKAPMTFR
jgi:hypothetical protein